MKLYPNRYLVYRRMEKGEEFPANGVPVLGPDGWLYKPVDSADCFVLKRRDILATAALEAYAEEAYEFGASDDLGRDVDRVAADWRQTPNRKLPD